MTTAAVSTASSAGRLWPRKSGAPGVSMKWTRVSPRVRCSTLALSECCMRRSSGSKSLTVVPRSSVPGVTIAPAATSSASARLVLPAAAGPTSASVRIDSTAALGAGKWAWHAGSPSAVARGKRRRRIARSEGHYESAPGKKSRGFVPPSFSLHDRLLHWPSTRLRLHHHALPPRPVVPSRRALFDERVRRRRRALDQRRRGQPAHRAGLARRGARAAAAGHIGALDRNGRRAGVLRDRRRRHARLRRLSLPERIGADRADRRRERRHHGSSLGDGRGRHPARRAVERLGDRRPARAQRPRRAALARDRLALLRDRDRGPRRCLGARLHRMPLPGDDAVGGRQDRHALVARWPAQPELRPGARVLARAVVGAARGVRRSARRVAQGPHRHGQPPAHAAGAARGRRARPHEGAPGQGNLRSGARAAAAVGRRQEARPRRRLWPSLRRARARQPAVRSRPGRRRPPHRPGERARAARDPAVAVPARLRAGATRRIGRGPERSIPHRPYLPHAADASSAAISARSTASGTSAGSRSG